MLAIILVSCLVAGFALDISAAVRVGTAFQRDPLLPVEIAYHPSRWVRVLGGYVSLVGAMIRTPDGRAVYAALMIGMYAFLASVAYAALA